VLLPPLWSEAIAWKPVIDQLSQVCDVWAINLPGYGHSSELAELRSVEELADVLAALLDAAGTHEPIDLVGWSMGGLLSQALAVRHPGLLRTLTLVNTSIQPAAGYDFMDEDVLVRTIGADLKRDLARNPDGSVVIARLAELGMKSQTPETLMYYLRFVAEYDYRIDARVIRTPTLIIGGAEDLATPSEQHSLPLHRAIAGSRLEVLPRVGHYIPMFRPQKFLRLVAAHIDVKLDPY
jgi:pimeloyl-ACP methyl ester carboxylesterase